MYPFHICRTLVLKDFGIVYLLPLLKNLFLTGINLTRLDLHYLDSSPGISIEDIDFTCPLLEQLTICDSLLTWTHNPYVSVATPGTKKSTHNHEPWFCKKHNNISCKEIDHFRNLKRCKLFRVDYREPEDWEIFLRFAPILESIHLESSRYMTDGSFQSILSAKTLDKLEVWLCK